MAAEEPQDNLSMATTARSFPFFQRFRNFRTQAAALNLCRAVWVYSYSLDVGRLTWLVYSPHCEPPPWTGAVAFRASDVASGSSTMRMKRAEHPVQPACVVKGRTDMAASR